MKSASFFYFLIYSGNKHALLIGWWSLWEMDEGCGMWEMEDA